MRNLRNGLVIALLAISSLQAQSLIGVVTATDTGAVVAGATVVAIQKSAAAGQQPVIYQSMTDLDGGYAIEAPPGEYSLCVHTMRPSLYLDPCQRGKPVGVTVDASQAAVVPLALQKGVRFVVRVHDPLQLLVQAETVEGTAVSAFVTSSSVMQFPLPMVYSGGNVRDYGTLVPIDVPMSVTISSNTVALSNDSGTALPTTPAPFQVLPTDIAVTGVTLTHSTALFSPPDAKIIHLYATAVR